MMIELRRDLAGDECLSVAVHVIMIGDDKVCVSGGIKGDGIGSKDKDDDEQWE